MKRPHLPASRPEVDAHLAMDLLAEPLEPGALAAAAPLVESMAGAPAAEAAIVRAAYDSARGEQASARAALASADPAAAPPGFRLLALEARARLAQDAAAREEVRTAARALPRDALGEQDAARLDALLAPER
ncbi:MAG TPA: hypothetical protein VFL83_05460 [Anaeromyxobacter sp.]|nr:hypothetical protein [Anaeromyxobacter sp.]